MQHCVRESIEGKMRKKLEKPHFSFVVNDTQMSQHTDADSAVHVRDARQLNGDSTPLRNTSQPTSTQSATPSNSSTSPNGDVTTSTIRGATPGAQVRERNSELEALAKLAPVQKKRDSFVELEEEQRRRRR